MSDEPKIAMLWGGPLDTHVHELGPFGVTAKLLVPARRDNPGPGDTLYFKHVYIFQSADLEDPTLYHYTYGGTEQ